MRSIQFNPLRVSQIAILALLTAGITASAAHAQTTVKNNGEGTHDGYFYSLYTSGGSSTMTLNNAGNYAISWSDVSDMVGGVGYNPGGSRDVGYNVGYASNYNNISVYGWTTNPLVEYYICEFGSVANGSEKGSVSSDGHEYTTYEHKQVNQPSIQGTATFEQYLDNWGGSSIGSNHNVNTGNHFNHWNSIGLKLGSYNYMILATESYGGRSGGVNASVF